MKAINFKKAPKKVIGLDALTKKETLKELKGNMKLPYKREMKQLFNEGKIQPNTLYWIYDSSAPIQINEHGELSSFYKTKGITNKAFFIGVPKKEKGFHAYKRAAKKSEDVKLSSPKSDMKTDLEIISNKLDLIVEMLNMGGKPTNGNSLTVTKGDVTIKL